MCEIVLDKFEIRYQIIKTMTFGTKASLPTIALTAYSFIVSLTAALTWADACGNKAAVSAVMRAMCWFIAVQSGSTVWSFVGIYQILKVFTPKSGCV